MQGSQPKSLLSSVLATYTYDDLKELCFAPESTFGSAFDCNWDVWRSKAVADFNISPQFFDLVPTLTGPQRYLQIATYVKLSPLSLAGQYDDETCPCFIEGVYESFSGMEEARERRDGEMMVWFAQRVTPEEDAVLGRFRVVDSFTEAKRMVAGWFGGLLKDLRYPPRNGKYDMYYLGLVIRHGRIDILDQIIHKYFTLPEGFSIEKDIPKVPFWEYQGVTYDLPLQTTPDVVVEEYMEDCMSTSDTRIVDFFRSIFRNRNLQSMISKTTLSKKSLLIHGKPEEAYGIALRFIKENTGVEYLDYMVELVLQQTAQEDSYWRLIHRNLGNITFIQALLPHVKKYHIEEIFEDLEDHDYVLYALSIYLLEQSLS
ncbi:hypothetical protein BQ9231_00445 [Cedratvirus lausannensis]|uniref:Uncharacterized protein n=1 Tax=Cedratvirus lausannensis TaxID=2023205 RepID=A0A285PXC9_9VIRU|nr:hypothetical protein BQ9231_00445 [Cedratvirus lausannensis]